MKKKKKERVELTYNDFGYDSGLPERFKKKCKKSGENHDQDDLEDEQGKSEIKRIFALK